MYTKCFDLDDNIVYELSFWYRVMDYSGITYPEKLEVKYGLNAEHTAMTNTIVDLGFSELAIKGRSPQGNIFTKY